MILDGEEYEKWVKENPEEVDKLAEAVRKQVEEEYDEEE